MIRHCDGTDPNLIRRIEREARWDDPVEVQEKEYEPCACGLRFDDVYRMTVYPHIRIAGHAIDQYARRGH